MGEYQAEVAGIDNPFDVHRQTVTQPSIAFTNLLPGSSYTVRIRAADRARTLGPWTELSEAKTQGSRELQIFLKALLVTVR